MSDRIVTDSDLCKRNRWPHFIVNLRFMGAIIIGMLAAYAAAAAFIFMESWGGWLKIVAVLFSFVILLSFLSTALLIISNFENKEKSNISERAYHAGYKNGYSDACLDMTHQTENASFEGAHMETANHMTSNNE